MCEPHAGGDGASLGAEMVDSFLRKQAPRTFCQIAAESSRLTTCRCLADLMRGCPHQLRAALVCFLEHLAGRNTVQSQSNFIDEHVFTEDLSSSNLLNTPKNRNYVLPVPPDSGDAIELVYIALCRSDESSSV